MALAFVFFSRMREGGGEETEEVWQGGREKETETDRQRGRWVGQASVSARELKNRSALGGSGPNENRFTTYLSISGT